MGGIEIRFDTSAFGRDIQPRLDRLADLDTRKLLDVVGALGVLQTQRRIREEKKSPDGTPWKPNRRGGSILMFEDNLLGSQDHDVRGDDEVAWGSNLVYAAIHQTGGTIKAKNKKALSFRIGNQWITRASVDIPARPYLGISTDNVQEITDTINDWIEGLLQ